MRKRSVNRTDSRLAVAYCRVSTVEQCLGVEAQRAAVERWSASAGIRVVAWHEDRLSGATPAADRPGLLAALADLKAHGAGLLVAAKRDRIARDVVVAATVERLTRDAGARVVTTDGVAIEDTAEGALMRTLMDAWAQYERACISTRTRAALRAKMARGERLGAVPFGFRLDGVAIVRHEPEQAALARIAELRQAGATLAGICATLNREGVPARGKRWHLTTVAVLVRSGRAVAA